MATRTTRDKWIKTAEALIEREKERKARAEATARECQTRVDAAEARIRWLKGMPVDDESTDVEVGDVEPDEAEILDVRAAADALPEDEEFEYPAPEGPVPTRKRVEPEDGEPSDWAQDSARA